MTKLRESSHREETIVAVRPGIRRPEPAPVPARQRDLRRPVIGLASLIALAAIVTVFFLLPRWVEQRAAEREAAEAESVAAAPAPPQEPALTEEELAALEMQAETLLGELLPQQVRLQELSAEKWGGEAWQRYDEAYRLGDSAYLAKEFQDAVPHYQEALDIGEQLIERSAEIVKSALATGEQALEAGDSALAVEQFDIVLGIDAEHPEATKGRERAERLPDVLELVGRGDELARERQYADAAEAFRQALAIDPQWPAAKKGLASATHQIEDARFEALMSQGFAALGDEDFELADKRFQDALKMRPDSSEAHDGLIEAEQGMKLDRIALAEARALAFERRELWDRAIAQYEEALETDPTLAFANEGLARARARSDLHAKLDNLIENPSLLLDDGVLGDAELVLADARAVENPGPQLQGAIARLDDLITLAKTPLTVTLRSDELTDVTVYRVGVLGTFSSRDISVRPGTYTVVGSRQGYRDVRKTFTVLPGREISPVEIACVEPI